MKFSRFAIYYTPTPGPLADFGARWLGWDMSRGQETPHPDLPGLPAKEISEVTQNPRRYGFHATIKPPFHLAQGADAASLTHAFQRAAQERPPVTLPGLKLSRIGGFLALVVDGDQTPVAQLAGHMVATLDHFRAPATDQELARRRRAGLTPRQEEMLLTWGYPYLFDEFRFHLTLTGKLDVDHAGRISSTLEPILTPLLPCPFTIGDLTLVGEDAAGNFHEISRIALGASGAV
ncbi:DUF1045 domain-containing protein [Aliiroseovarius sp. KMU-50]|uniref:DUF1045 domain-containing protein n=2 Tax=Aliiroseovarius salicola TaxID=3009082 RepID=A0ABT4VZT7_9RHOB|nr:DUF1045 domain-containing protein [Aliiroseovarius sp. KMU-50]MDA5093779.1 DUF1045 domain-containing protein [Aliiroseovarius sp. KMU-50]